jgi:hypothetical protein
VRELIVTKREWKPEVKRQQAVHQNALIFDDVRLIDEQTGATIAVQSRIPTEYADLKRELGRHLRFRVKYDSGTTQARLSGIKSSSRMFGFTAPQPLRRRYGVADALFSVDFPEANHLLAQFAKIQQRMFSELVPEAYEEHMRLTDPIHRDWWFGSTPWTSGVIKQHGRTSVSP